MTTAMPEQTTVESALAAPPHETIETDQVVQSVVKALGVLEQVGTLGVATVGQLSTDCDLPKATIVRLLQTLVICGYVRQISPRAGYCLTSRLDMIGNRFSGVASLLEAGIPFCDQLTDEIDWPVSLATVDGNNCVVQYSTIPKSPYAHARSTIGKRLPLASSAHGKATLAFLSADQRAILSLRTSDEDRHNDCNDGALAVIRSRGYAVRTPGRDPTTNTIAAPILVAGAVKGTIGITFFSGSIKPETIQELGAMLIDGASEVAAGIQRHEHFNK